MCESLWRSSIVLDPCRLYGSNVEELDTLNLRWKNKTEVTTPNGQDFWWKNCEKSQKCVGVCSKISSSLVHPMTTSLIGTRKNTNNFLLIESIFQVLNDDMNWSEQPKIRWFSINGSKVLVWERGINSAHFLLIVSNQNQRNTKKKEIIFHLLIFKVHHVFFIRILFQTTSSFRYKMCYSD